MDRTNLIKYLQDHSPKKREVTVSMSADENFRLQFSNEIFKV